MAGYDINALIRPKKAEAHIEHFFTRNEKNLYCIVPGFRPTLRLRNFVVPKGAKAVLMGSNRFLPLKQAGADCVVDLSSLKPGEVYEDLFAVKLQNAFQK
jgi:alpha-L-fucosidase